MPSKCCVASRKLNYDSTDPSVTTFAFPDEQKAGLACKMGEICQQKELDTR